MAEQLHGAALAQYKRNRAAVHVRHLLESFRESLRLLEENEFVTESEYTEASREALRRRIAECEESLAELEGEV